MLGICHREARRLDQSCPVVRLRHDGHPLVVDDAAVRAAGRVLHEPHFVRGLEADDLSRRDDLSRVRDDAVDFHAALVLQELDPAGARKTDLVAVRLTAVPVVKLGALCRVSQRCSRTFAPRGYTVHAWIVVTMPYTRLLCCGSVWRCSAAAVSESTLYLSAVDKLKGFELNF